MKALIDQIKAARAAKELGTFANWYIWKSGRIYASDGRMGASIPCELVAGLERLIPGDELERLLSRLPGDGISINHDANSVTVKSGRMRGEIQTLDTSAIGMLIPDLPWAKPPEGLIAAMKAARPFVADVAARTYALCMCLRNGRLLATTNLSIIEVLVPELDTGGVDLLVPSAAVDFIIKAQGELEGVILNANYAAFRWSTGLQLRTQLDSDSFPAPVNTLLESVATKQPIYIAPAWRKAFMDVASISEDNITIENEKIIGGAGRSRVEHDTEPLGVTEPAHFNPAYLVAVIELAEYWSPNLYAENKPIQFIGPSVRGLVSGKRS